MPVTVVVCLVLTCEQNFSTSQVESKHLCSQAWNHNLQSFCSFMHQTSVGSWGSAPDPDVGACSTPPYLLAGQQGAIPPAPSPGGGFLNFIQILHLAVCTLPYMHVYYPGYATAWLSPLITCFAPPEHATWLRA